MFWRIPRDTSLQIDKWILVGHSEGTQHAILLPRELGEGSNISEVILWANVNTLVPTRIEGLGHSERKGSQFKLVWGLTSHILDFLWQLDHRHAIGFDWFYQGGEGLSLAMLHLTCCSLNLGFILFALLIRFLLLLRLLEKVAICMLLQFCLHGLATYIIG
jgi:pimeloyl-ACP methyl ester carboxylesterase